MKNQDIEFYLTVIISFNQLLIGSYFKLTDSLETFQLSCFLPNFGNQNPKYIYQRIIKIN